METKFLMPPHLIEPYATINGNEMKSVFESSYKQTHSDGEFSHSHTVAVIRNDFARMLNSEIEGFGLTFRVEVVDFDPEVNDCIVLELENASFGDEQMTIFLKRGPETPGVTRITTSKLDILSEEGGAVVDLAAAFRAKGRDWLSGRIGPFVHMALLSKRTELHDIQRAFRR